MQRLGDLIKETIHLTGYDEPHVKSFSGTCGSKLRCLTPVLSDAL
jgi:hypothetical protein